MSWAPGQVLLSPDGSVTKVLVVDTFGERAHVLHVCSYQGRFTEQTAKAALAAKTLAPFVMHAPFDPAAFDDAKVIATEPVLDDELEGYRTYLEAMAAPPQERGPDESMVQAVLDRLRSPHAWQRANGRALAFEVFYEQHARSRRTALAIPALLSLLESRWAAEPEQLVLLLARLAGGPVGFGPLGVELAPFPTVARTPEEKACRDAVRAGLPVVLARSGARSSKVRAAVMVLLGMVPEESARSVPVLQVAARHDASPQVRACAVLALGRVAPVAMPAPAPNEASELVRLARACTLGELDVLGQGLRSPSNALVHEYERLPWVAPGQPDVQTNAKMAPTLEGELGGVARRLSPSQLEPLRPALLDALRRARGVNVRPLMAALIHHAFPEGVAPAEPSGVQREVLAAFVANPDCLDLWSTWQVESLGLPGDRVKLAAFLGIEAAEDAVAIALREARDSQVIPDVVHRAITRALSVAPNDARVWAALGATLGWREPEKAKAAFAKALELDAHCAPAHLGLAELHDALEQEPEGRAAWSRASAVDPGALSRWASELHAQGRHAEALEALRAGVPKWPRSLEAWSALANAAFKAGALEEARAAAARALELEPDDGFTWSVLACVEEKAGAREKALEAARLSLELDPGLRELMRDDPDLGELAASAEFVTLLE